MKSYIVCIAFVAASSLPAATITNPSFETPNLGSGSYQYNPSGATWVFSGTSGIAANGSGFGFASAPDGNQVAFLQIINSTTSSISQTITNVSPGDTIFFDEAQRPQGGGNSFDVLYAGVVIGSFTPPSDTFTQVSVQIQNGGPSSGTLTFESTGPTGSDVSVAIDNPTITSASSAPEPGTLGLILPVLSGLGLTLLRGKRRRA